MPDPILSLSMSLHQNPGVYAVLVGSGISRSAGVPTGWDIILELIQRLAHLHGETIARNQVEAWYREKFGREPEYGRLLGELAKSPAERAQLLRGFFEPTEEERTEGRKLSTDAHHAIAELVENGHVRVIVTTNFDRLMERALEARGIVPTVIASVDAAKGALPLAHARCTIIKVHGDYLDTRIRNTPQELEGYPGPLNRILDQVLDEYGLIVCGWSADWDPALRAAIERTKGRRFTTYWAVVGQPSPAARRLIQLRGAEVITIEGADSFFGDLAEKVTSLDELARPHPLSAEIAVQSLKRYLPDPLHRIRLYDLVIGETDRVIRTIPTDTHLRSLWSPEEFNRQIRFYETTASMLVDLLAAGCFHGQGQHDSLWVGSLSRIGRATGGLRAGMVPYIKALGYPSLLLLYAGGIAAVLAGRYDTLRALTMDARRLNDQSEMRPLIETVNTGDVMEQQVGQLLPGMERTYTPVSSHLERTLEPSLLTYAGGDVAFREAFDRFEYLLYLIEGYANHQRTGRTYASLGSFAWRNRRTDQHISQIINRELGQHKNAWPPLQASLFGGEIGNLLVVKQELDDDVQRARMY